MARDFPPLAGSEWVTGDPERLAKLTIHGLVPMTPFGGILGDEEIANLLTYIRNDFGNKAPAVQPQQVSAVRAATQSQAGFYRAQDLSSSPPTSGQ